MRARGAPIRCDAVTLAAHWPLLLPPLAAAAAVALIAVHGGFLFAGSERNHKPCSNYVAGKALCFVSRQLIIRDRQRIH